MDIVLATGNTHKVRELSGLLRVPGIRWRSLKDFPPMPPVREDGATFEANAAKKALAVARATGGYALADDSGIEVQALAWGPGVRSARFAGRHGDDASNNAKLLKVLKGLPPSKRRARYRCVLVIARPGKVIAMARGTWTGRIAEAPRGAGGFGYDPLFVVGESRQTAAELPARTKARLSHRAVAAARLKPALRRLATAAAGRRRRGYAGS